MNFDVANPSFLHPFRRGGNRFSKISGWSSEWGTGTCIKIHRFNPFSRNVNSINLKLFSTNGGIYKLEKIQQAFKYKKYERCILEANLEVQGW